MCASMGKRGRSFSAQRLTCSLRATVQRALPIHSNAAVTVVLRETFKRPWGLHLKNGLIPPSCYTVVCLAGGALSQVTPQQGPF